MRILTKDTYTLSNNVSDKSNDDGVSSIVKNEDEGHKNGDGNSRLTLKHNDADLEILSKLPSSFAEICKSYDTIHYLLSTLSIVISVFNVESFFMLLLFTHR